MNVLTPWALAFALTLPVVILFYLLKRRRVVLRVPSTVLWRRYLAETQANAPFQKLRWTWPLLLQLLLLALAVFALLRPFLAGQERPSSLRVLILDASASMQSRDVEPSRFEAARAEARRWIDSLKPGQRMVLLQAGPRTEVRQSATSDGAALRRALDACVVTDGGSRVGEALKMAESLIRDVADPEIHLFSDGALGVLDEFENRNLPLVFHRVGTRRQNVAFASLEARANPENPGQRAVFTSLANLGPEPVVTQVELAFEGEVLDAQEVTVAAGETEPLVFLVQQPRDGVYTVRHTAADDLPADNQASVMSLLPQPVRVVLVTRGNRFLEKALRAAGSVELTVAQDMPATDEGWDFVVLDAVAPARWPSVNTLALRVSAPGWFDEIAPLQAPPIVEWRSAHPLLRFVNLDNVQVSEAAGVRAPAWGEVVVAATQGPLLVAGDQERRRVVWVGFDVLRSTWPLRLSFPMFVANAVDYLNPATARAERLNLRAGDPLRFDVPAGVTRVEVRPPGGAWQELGVDAGAREAVFGATDRQGVYALRWGTNEVNYAVRALDLRESDSEPRSEIRVGRFGGTTETTLRAANVEIWRWFVGAGLMVLALEWWYFHRRTA